MSEKDWLQQDLQISFLAQSRSTDRSTVGRAELLCRSIDMHQVHCVHFNRQCGRPTERVCSRLGQVDRLDQMTESFALWLEKMVDQWTDRSTAIPKVKTPINGSRLAGRLTEEFSTDFFPTAIFQFVFFWVFPNDSFEFSPHVFIPVK